VDDVPMALTAFQGQLAAGVGKALRLYEMGKKQLLRKCENNVCRLMSPTTGAAAYVTCFPQTFPTAILTLNVQGSRLIVGDIQESTFFVAYKAIPTRQLLVFADDTQTRWITATQMVDYETVACGDKFGNIFINRLPDHVSKSVDEDPTGAGIMHEKSYLMGAAHKTSLLMHYYVGSVVTS
jgi:splicing factor 3B subunit 3